MRQSAQIALQKGAERTGARAEIAQVQSCGDDDSSDGASTAATSAATAPGTTTPAARPIANPFREPATPPHGGSVDTLTVRDVTVGDGEEVQAGDTIIADYAGALYRTGRQFDSSWRRGREPLEIKIDNGGVIAGWWQGIPGMRVGGRRTLAIPAALGYGEAGSGAAIPPNSDLYFVVDVLGVRKAEPAAASPENMAPPAGG
jgi:FKBP-type peptidyl-prolyl cis-trans isomerase